MFRTRKVLFTSLGGLMRDGAKRYEGNFKIEQVRKIIPQVSVFLELN